FSCRTSLGGGVGLELEATSAGVDGGAPVAGSAVAGLEGANAGAGAGGGIGSTDSPRFAAFRCAGPRSCTCHPNQPTPTKKSSTAAAIPAQGRQFMAACAFGF